MNNDRCISEVSPPNKKKKSVEREHTNGGVWVLFFKKYGVVIKISNGVLVNAVCEFLLMIRCTVYMQRVSCCF